MWLRRGVAPLVAGTTYRRAVFLLLGGFLLLPYLLLGVVLTRLWNDSGVPHGASLPLICVAAVIAGVPLFLGGSRALEIAAARSLLDVELPEPASRRVGRETRLRGALWAGVHMATGGVVGLGLVTVLPAALLLTARPFGVRLVPGQPFGRIDEALHGSVAAPAGLLALAALCYCVAALGTLARSMAPALLGPTQVERIAALEARARRLAERDLMARELHDSIGHALTVTTLQAAAARELLDADPEFAREALRTIEETGRAATDELDHVLGLLREQDQADAGPAAGTGVIVPAPRHTLTDVGRLVAGTRAAGVLVETDVSGQVDELPLVVSREGYRIVQEGLTNAARHGGGPVTLRIAASEADLDIDLVNPLAADTCRFGQVGGGRGLAGMRERVLTLGGSMSAGRDDDVWRVSVRLPAPKASSKSEDA